MKPHEYFEPEKGIWSWDEKEEFILMKDTVLLNKQHLKENLKDLLPIGFPNFTALLFVIAASNSRTKKAAFLVLEDIPHSFSYKDTHSSVQSFLNKIHQLPEEYKQADGMKRMLSTVFYQSHNSLSRKASALCFDYFIGKRFSNKVFHYKEGTKEIKKSLQVLRLLNERYPTTQSIIDDMLNIPEIEEEIELPTIEQTEEQTTEEYLEELEDNNQTFQVGTLVKTLWAGLKLPVQSAKPSEQPIGGVSDLDNKGDLSQLLISEFANEDLLFLSRLANNEALYLRREAPPQENDTKRIFLIDVSLKNWGIPKVLSFATMLAMALHPKNKSECEAYIIGGGYKKVDFTNTKELITGLQIVDAGIDCSKGLHDYFNNEAQWQNAEHILLTENSTDDSSNFALALSKYRSKIKYKILTDHDGRIDLYKNLPNQRRHIQQLQIPYERLWKERKRKYRPQREKINLREEDNRYIPTLVAPPRKTKERFVTEAGNLYLLTKEGDLLRRYYTGEPFYRYANDAKGFEVVYTNLKIAEKHAIGEHTNGEVLFLSYSDKTKIVTVINLSTKEKIEYDLFNYSNSIILQFFYSENQFFVYDNSNKYVFSRSGEVEPNRSDPHIMQRHFSHKGSRAKHYGYNSDTNILKNVKSVFINSQGELQLNKHAIKTRDYPDEALGLFNYNETPSEGQIIAEEIGDKHFQFPDGSIVIVHPAGFAECVSADPKIQSFYFPMALDWAFTASTVNKCHSHGWFSHSGAYQISLHGQITMPQDVEKAIKQIHKSLKIKSEWPDGFIGQLMTEITQNGSVMLPFYFPEEKAQAVKRIEAYDKGITVNIQPTRFVEQIGRDKFMEDIYRPFIDNIVDHGA